MFVHRCNGLRHQNVVDVGVDVIWCLELTV